jgi:uncharacterized protein (DUF433 family)
MAKALEACPARITQDPRVMIGKPVVRGTRIPVERVIAHLAHNLDLDDLFAAYPELTLEDVKACLQYAYAVVERDSRRAQPEEEHTPCRSLSRPALAPTTAPTS